MSRCLEVKFLCSVDFDENHILLDLEKPALAVCLDRYRHAESHEILKGVLTNVLNHIYTKVLCLNASVVSFVVLHGEVLRDQKIPIEQPKNAALC